MESYNEQVIDKAVYHFIKNIVNVAKVLWNMPMSK